MLYKIDKNKGKGYELTLTITSKKPIKLLVIGKEKHSKVVFFQRKYNGKQDNGFVGTEKFNFKLPIKPKSLKIYCINALNGSTESITINKIEHKNLTETDFYSKQPSHIKEFIDFAEWFAHNSLNLKLGTYFSKNKLYKIVYKHILTKPSTGEFWNTPAWTNRQTGEIQASKSFLTQLTPTNILMILFHEFHHFNAQTIDEKACDLNAINMCLNLGYAQSECIYSLERLFGEIEGTDAIPYEERMQVVVDFALNFKA